MRIALAVTFVLLAAGCTCRSSRPAGIPPGDADVDTDADTDTDVDTDADTDSDTGFDAGPCNGLIGGRIEHQGARHCDTDGGPDGGCAYIEWNNNPPASGPHCPRWEYEDGEHVTQIDRCNWVHNLEHGWVVLLHNCGAVPCDSDLELMRQVIREGPREAGGSTRMLMTPDALLDSRLAAVGWDWVWEGESATLEGLRCFVQWHYGNGPEGGGMPDGGVVLDAGAAPDGGV